MKSDSTLSVALRNPKYGKKQANKKACMPSEKVLSFVKLFARNYQVEKELPEGMQEMMLS